MQRAFDILFSIIALLVFSPIFFICVFILKFTGEGEVFYKQERIGKDRKVFSLYKFATMLKNSPKIGTGSITLKNDPRVLPFGKVLRKTKFNELPQLLNILFGDMSIIGPRPLTQETFNYYPERLKVIISLVRPGLSGIGSIIFRSEEDILGEASNAVDLYCDVIAPYKALLEVWYVNRRKLSDYFVLMLATIWIVLFSQSSLIWFLYSDLPIPPDNLKKFLGFDR